MPTKSQVEELNSYCSKTFVSGSDVTFKSNNNSNSIFLPLKGIMNPSLSNVGSEGYYWTHTKNTSYSNVAWFMKLDSFYKKVYFDSVMGTGARMGMSIRPVTS